MLHRLIDGAIKGLSIIAFTFFTFLVFSSSAYAVGEFNFKKATPLGSWSVREDLTTNHKGKQTVAVVKTSLVDKEMVEGSLHYWVEVEMQNYKLKKDKRKKQGDKMIMKVLIDSSTFSDSPANVVGNLNKYASTVIMQNGNADPMKIEQGGAMAQSMMSAMGVSVEFDFSEGGSKKVNVPAGNISCKVLKGSGTTETKVMIKTFKVSSETESCYSNDIPFGLVYSTADIVTNGKKSTTESKLMEFGKSGAVTAITKTPTEMPKMPKLF